MPEYMEYRCCMCPNQHDHPESRCCPEGTPISGKPRTPCRYVKAYIDDRGWSYRVQQGLGESNYKARYNKKQGAATGWKCMPSLPWRKTFDEAQSDLNKLAQRKGWREVAEQLGCEDDKPKSPDGITFAE